jgi:hypothetical protein
MHSGEGLIIAPLQSGQAVEIGVGHEVESNKPCSHEQGHNVAVSPDLGMGLRLPGAEGNGIFAR